MALGFPGAHSGSLWINKERALTVAGNRRRSTPDTINPDRDKDSIIFMLIHPFRTINPSITSHWIVVSSSDKK